MEKKDLDLETKRLKTAQRRENENETNKKYGVRNAEVRWVATSNTDTLS